MYYEILDRVKVWAKPSSFSRTDEKEDREAVSEGGEIARAILEPLKGLEAAESSTEGRRRSKPGRVAIYKYGRA